MRFFFSKIWLLFQALKLETFFSGLGKGGAFFLYTGAGEPGDGSVLSLLKKVGMEKKKIKGLFF